MASQRTEGPADGDRRSKASPRAEGADELRANYRHFLAIPTHVCPTVALHARAYVVREGEVVDEWEVSARNRVVRI